MTDEQKKILVVEDDNMLRNIIMSQLQAKYKVIPARDGQEALQQIEKQRPHAIILDLALPKVDGFGVLERLRSMADTGLAQTPVIIVSNLSSQQDQDRAKGYNVDAYYTKAQVNLGTVMERIHQLFP
jgi:CheY-like chemotaxis protein